MCTLGLILSFTAKVPNAGINLTSYHPPSGAFVLKCVPSPRAFAQQKMPGAGPINDDVPGAEHLYQLAFKHENHQHSYLGLKIKMSECPVGQQSPEDSEHYIKLLICSRPIN